MSSIPLSSIPCEVYDASTRKISVLNKRQICLKVYQHKTEEGKTYVFTSSLDPKIAHLAAIGASLSESPPNKNEAPLRL
jgi:hypothetical protein